MTNFLKAQWENIVMVNYAVPESVLLPYLPVGCELDLYKGKSYVSLVGFMFKDTSLFRIPIPFLGTFEEINLRFYVTRKEGGQTKRGVVFINETIPYKAVAWVANKLYKEHYTVIPTKNAISIGAENKLISYLWQVGKTWNSISIEFSAQKHKMPKGSFDEFIFEHYYGYTRVSSSATIEYKIDHPSWQVNQVNKQVISCDFKKMYGESFAMLNEAQPYKVLLAEGSAVTVKWKRKRLKLRGIETD